MSVEAIALVTYLWHYLVARMIYDHLVRPLLDGDPAGLVLLACVAGASFILGRRTRRRA
jgi:hypothetical protein